MLVWPPVFAAAASIFPGAIFLYEHGFDLAELFRQPGYYDAGPNSHGNSILVPLTALVYAVTRAATPTFVVLHLFHMALGACVLSQTYEMLRAPLGRATAAVATLAMLLFPVFLVQTQNMYLELPLLLCTLMVARAYAAAAPAQASVWAALAAATKETGYFVAACLAFLLVMQPGSAWRRARRGLLALAPALALAGFQWFVVMPLEGTYGGHAVVSFAETSIGLATCVPMDLQRYLWMAPDLALIVFGSLAAATGTLPMLRHGLLADASDAGGTRARSLTFGLTLLLAFFAFHHVLLPVLRLQCAVLVRYYLLLVPFCLLLLSEGLLRRVRPAVARGVLSLVIVFFVVNREGRFYPSEHGLEGPGVNPAVTERSIAYRHVVAVQREAARRLGALPEDMPKFYELHFQYLLHHPLMGYVKRPIRNGHNLFAEPYRRARLVNYPDCFVAYYQSPWLGGDVLLALLRNAARQGTHRIDTLARIASGAYTGELIRVRRDAAQCPALEASGLITLD